MDAGGLVPEWYLSIWCRLSDANDKPVKEAVLSRKSARPPAHTNTDARARPLLFPKEREQMILASSRRHREMKDRRPIAPVTPVKAGWVYFISNGRRNGRSRGGIWQGRVDKWAPATSRRIRNVFIWLCTGCFGTLLCVHVCLVQYVQLVSVCYQDC